MKLAQFDFNLPKEFIAQKPCRSRDESKLLVMKPDGSLVDEVFYNIVDYFQEGDLVIFNNSKVIKAKLTINKNGRSIDLSLNKQMSEKTWMCFAKPAKKLEVGDEFDFAGNIIKIRYKHESGEIEVEFDLKAGLGLMDFLDIYGEVPLPPYITDDRYDLEHEDRYQTIYAEEPGSVAVPSAGLHFSDDVIVQMKKRGVDYAFVTLHVGPGTFLPVKTENIAEHIMHSEVCTISAETAQKIHATREKGGRIIAVGSTSMRTLEAAMGIYGEIKPCEFETNIFIIPGYEFKLIDMMVTNFHLPKSTLLMLVCAFAGYENIMHMYKHAVEKEYRFFSYGDATLLYRKDSDEI